MSFPLADLKRSDHPGELVPRDFDANLDFRDALSDFVGELDSEQWIWEWCRKDVLFYANALVWTIDPKRYPGSPVRPWVNFPYQDELFLELEETWGSPDSSDSLEQRGHDRCWVKSRDMGCSWIPLIGADRRFLCFDTQMFTFVSDNEDLVDDLKDPSTMFPKIDFMHSRLPPFITRGVNRNKLIFTRDGALSVLKGASTTKKTSAGSRPTGIIADEYGIWDVGKSIAFLASSSGASNSRLFLGTPKGQGNGFHKVATDSGIPRTNIHWTKHPWHTIGLYTSAGEGGEVEFRDKPFWEAARFSWLKRQYPLLSRRVTDPDGKPIDGDPLLRDVYEFKRTGKVRSPYYDHECLRTPFPWQVAQEQDLDFLGSGSPFYDPAAIELYINRHCLGPAVLVGDLTWNDYTYEPDEFTESAKGRLHLWANLILHRGKYVPSTGHKYQIGVDVSAGTGASNSVISVWDCTERTKVARYMRADRRPERLAEIAYAIGKWFGSCNIIFEGSGPGSGFGGRLVELHYPSVFWMTNDKGVRRKEPGLFFEGTGKTDLLTEYGTALFNGEAVNRDGESVKEGFAFQLGADSNAEHVESKTAENPGGAKKNHGDAWMSDCLAWYKVKKHKNIDRHEVPAHSSDDRWEEIQREAEERRHARSYW